jgi:hypothetical protein
MLLYNCHFLNSPKQNRNVKLNFKLTSWQMENMCPSKLTSPQTKQYSVTADRQAVERNCTEKHD